MSTRIAGQCKNCGGVNFYGHQCIGIYWRTRRLAAEAQRDLAYEEILRVKANLSAAEAEVKQQGITIGYFQQKLDAAEALLAHSLDVVPMNYGPPDRLVFGTEENIEYLYKRLSQTDHKLSEAEAERDAYISKVAMLVSDRNGWAVRILELEQERDQYKRESEELRAQLASRS